PQPRSRRSSDEQMGRIGSRAGLAAVALGMSVLAAAPALGADAPGLHVSTFRGPASVSAGERARVVGRVSPAQATPVLVQRQTASGWAPFATLQAGPDGRFS